MLESSETLMAWGAYLLAAVGIMAVWWRLTRFIPWMLPKQLLRVMLAALLLVPAPVSGVNSDWAPAIFVLLFDMTLVDQRDPLRAVSYLLYAQGLALVVLILDGLARHFLFNRSAEVPEPQPMENPT